MNLKEFISKNKENNADELVRCGSCQNSLVHAGKYEVVQLGQVEGILCETCKNTDRKLRIATKISEDGKRVSQITVETLLLEPPSPAKAATTPPPPNNNKNKEKQTSK